MNTNNHFRAVSPRLLIGSMLAHCFHFDKDQEGGGDGGDIGEGLKTLTKSVQDLLTKNKDSVQRAELEPLQKSIDKLILDFKEIKVGRDNNEDDPTFGFKNLGDFAMSVWDAGPTENRSADKRLRVMAKNTSTPTGVSQGYDPSIGFLFPPAFSQTINETPYEEDDLLSRVRHIPIDKSAESITLPYVDDQDRSTGSVRGGVQAKWKSEAEQMTGTRPKLRPIKLEPHELYAMCWATDKSLRNSPISLGAWLQDAMRRAIAFKIGDAIVNGDGAGKPRGILNSPSKITVNKATGQAANALVESNVAAMWKRMPAWMRSQAIWLANQDIEDALDLMPRTARAADGTESTSAAVDTKLYDSDKNTLKGRPIVYSEYSPAQGTEGDITLWYPGSYLVATKVGEDAKASSHLRFDFAETAFRIIQEIDGRSEYPAVFTPYKGSTTRSDIVTLQTRP